jgi:hypothetical protein
MAENKYSRGMMKNQYLNVKGQPEGGIKIKDATRIYVSFSAGADYFQMGNAFKGTYKVDEAELIFSFPSS